MASKRVGQKIVMPSIDDILGVPDSECSTEIEVSRIHEFKNHPFKVIDDEKMHELVESIMSNGVLTPVIVREDPLGGYEMISGHRRMFAVKQIGFDTIPAIIRDLDDDQATLAMVDANLQREEILPSEKAFAYRMRYEAMIHQGQRSDLTSGHNDQKLCSREKLAKQVGESDSNIKRYMRLVELIPELLTLVDNKQLGVALGADISYIDKTIQKWLYEYMRENGVCKTYQITALRDYIREKDSITQMDMIKLLNEFIPGKKDEHKITLKEKKLHEYFPAFFTKKQMENIIFNLLEDWKKNQENENGI